MKILLTNSFPKKSQPTLGPPPPGGGGVIPLRAPRISKKAGRHPPPLGEGIQATKKRLAQGVGTIDETKSPWYTSEVWDKAVLCVHMKGGSIWGTASSTMAPHHHRPNHNGLHPIAQCPDGQGPPVQRMYHPLFPCPPAHKGLGTSYAAKNDGNTGVVLGQGSRKGRGAAK
jgi:hypothetical protein